MSRLRLLYLALFVPFACAAASVASSRPAPPTSIDSWATIANVSNSVETDPVRSCLYFTITASAGLPNRIHRVQLAGQVLEQTYFDIPTLGPAPDICAASDDGQYLYVVSQQLGEVQRIDLAGMTLGFRFPLGGDGNLWEATDVEVLPGHPDELLTCENHPGAPSTDSVTALYDHSARVSFLDPGGTRHSCDSSAPRVFLFSTFEEVARTAEVGIGGSGLFLKTVSQTLPGTPGAYGKCYDGLIFGSNGTIYDVGSNTLLTTIPDVLGTPVVDRDYNRIYYLADTGDTQYHLVVYDRTTFAKVGEQRLTSFYPAADGDLLDSPDGGLVYRKPGGAVVLWSSFRPLKPVRPTDLVATPSAGGSIRLQWTRNPPIGQLPTEDGFKIERRAGGGGFVQIATVGTFANTYQDLTAQPSIQYQYRVRAYAGPSFSAYSNIASVSPLPNPPSAPSGLTAAALSYNRVRLEWQHTGDTEDGFEVERKVGAGSFVLVATAAANATSFEDAAAPEQSTCTYRVRAYNTGGYSSYSNEASAVTPAGPTAAPGSLTATAVAASQVQLQWEDHSVNELSFRIERKSSGAFSDVGSVSAHPSTGTVTYLDLNGLVADTQYTYRVKATGPLQDSSYSNLATASTFPAPPVAPSGLQAVTVSAAAVSLSWNDNSSDEDSFEIERKSGAGAFARVGNTTANMASFTDSSVIALTSYTYRVRALHGPSASTYSNELVVSTPASPLAAPTELTAAAVTSTEVRLNWRDTTSSETGFTIERKAAAGSFAPVGTRGASAGQGALTGYTDSSGLQANGTYTYRVKATGSGVESDYSNEATVSMALVVPAVPSGVAAVLNSATEIRITWTDNSLNETSFKVERKTGGGSFTTRATVAAEATQYLDAVAGDTVYTYRVRAVGTVGASDPSQEVTLATLPAKPLSLTATAAGAGRINLAWSDGSATETSFRIERAETGAFALVGTAGAGAISYADQNLAPNTTYRYRVLAVNDSGSSIPSNEASALTRPTLPSGLSATVVSASELALSWTDPNPGTAAMKVERALTGGAFVEVGLTEVGGSAYLDAGLAPATSYTYRIRATNASGDSGYSATATASTLPLPPPVPGDPHASVQSAHAVRLTWLDTSDQETAFEVHRRTGSGGFTLLQTVPANVLSFTDETAAENTQYGYQLRAVNTGGASPFTAVLTVTTPPTRPTTPGTASATAVTDTQLQLTWVDTSDNETGFRIERKSGSGSFTALTAVAANTGLYVNNGLSESTTYTYRVVALNSAGESSPSNETSATTLPRPPSALMAAALAGRVLLSWQDQSAGESGFRIERKTDGEFALLANVAAGATSYADTGVTAGTTYTYRVQATASGGGAAYSNEATATPIATTPLGKLTVSPAKLSFGSVKVNTAKAKAVKFTNKGKEPIQVLVGSLTAPYSVSQAGVLITLAPKKSASVTVTYRPSTKGVTSNASLQVFSTVPSALVTNVTITGKGK